MCSVTKARSPNKRLILIFCALQCLFFVPSINAQKEEFSMEQTARKTDALNNTNKICPEGFICNNGNQESCDDIREKVRDTFKFGDILAGTYCPAGDSQLENCPIGYVCKNSTSKEPCPSGKFCPHKTAVAEIECGGCSKGSTTIARPTILVPLFGTLIIVVILSIGLRLWLKRNSELVEKLKRLQNKRLDSKRQDDIMEEYRSRINKIRPALEILLKRVESIQIQEGDGSNSNFSMSMHSPDAETFEFDTALFYDQLFGNRKDGSVTYLELNKYLKLNPSQLEEFTHRMNELAGASIYSLTFSRSTFEECFLEVFEESKHFGPTPQECFELFDEIAGDTELRHSGSIPEELFYTSELSEFLNDTQINHILTRIRQLRKEDQSNQKETAGARLISNVYNRTNSALRMSVRILSTRPDEHMDVGTARYISKAEFLKYYPTLLKEATSLEVVEKDDVEGSSRKKESIDICFQDLSLTLKVGSGTVRVVDSVTGRLQPGTMTALMGGSGAGKTSLLNALCGRASYGKVTGVTKINGKIAAIDEHSTLVGFVPQDDIVYPELTVRENFIYSGRFRLPQGTDISDIEDLADQTIANLGLSRVGDTIVGDVKRRGVSGGEKKRVNIGLELMAKPSTLFLDEPTSGLDSSSAFLVMNSVRSLVDKHGLSACSVIHQPRKSIFDLFDSLILLGAGGKMVYHGAISEVEEYFTGLNYVSQPGESLADWLIDISTGHLSPKSLHPHTIRSIHPTAKPKVSQGKPVKRKLGATKAMNEKQKRGMSAGLNEMKSAIENNLELISAADVSEQFEEKKQLPANSRRPSIALLSYRHASIKGPSGNQEAHSEEDAKYRREILFSEWNDHFNTLTDAEKQIYSAPEEYPIPTPEAKPTFGSQLKIQMLRYCLVWKRNFISKQIDTIIIVGTAALISAMAGKAEVTVDSEIGVSYYSLVSNNPSALIPELPQIFRYALLPDEEMQKFTLRFGLVLVVLIGLTASKDITDKQTEFFREAASGYDVNAYFLAVNIMSTVEHLTQSFVAALIAWCIRQSVSKWLYFCMSFLALSWFAISWSLLIPLLVPPSNVTIVSIGGSWLQDASRCGKF